MTTKQIRKNVKVRKWSLKPHGIFISYLKWNDQSLMMEYQSLGLSPEESIKELHAMWQIDDHTDNYEWVKSNIILSQWYALNLVIGHEYRKSLVSDMNMLDIDKSLEALKNI